METVDGTNIEAAIDAALSRLDLATKVAILSG